MYEREGESIPLEEAQAAAQNLGLSLDGWAGKYGWAQNEGKTNGSTEITPPMEPVMNTPGGESTSGDTLLELPKTDILPGLQYAAEKDLFNVDETEGRKRLEAYFKGVPGIVFEEIVPGRDFLQIKYYDQNKNKKNGNASHIWSNHKM